MVESLSMPFLKDSAGVYDRFCSMLGE